MRYQWSKYGVGDCMGQLRLTFWGVLVFDYTPVHNCHCDLNPPFKYKKEKNNFSWTSMSRVFFLFLSFSFQIRCPNPTWVLEFCKFFFHRCQIRHSYLSQIPTPFLTSCAHVMLQRSITQPCWPSIVSCSGRSLATWSDLYYFSTFKMSVTRRTLFGLTLIFSFCCCSLEHGTGLTFRFVAVRPKDKQKMEDLQKEADMHHDFLFIDADEDTKPPQKM